MGTAVDGLRELQTEQKAALARWERAIQEVEAAVTKLACLEQKVEGFTFNVFLKGGCPINSRQRKAIEARPRLAVSGAGGMDRGAWRRRLVYDSRIGEVRELEARWQPRLEAARAKVQAAKVERHQAAKQLLALWPDPEPVNGQNRSSLSRL